nr:MAG TPA: hypothetical protein [Crassvirales sp.]
MLSYNSHSWCANGNHALYRYSYTFIFLKMKLNLCNGSQTI